MKLALALLVACGTPTPAPPATPAPIAAGSASVPIDAPAATEAERLAAIQKALNELSLAVQQCWAAVAVERYDIDGEIAAQIDIGPPNAITLVRDTTKSPKLAACVTALLDHYPWAPPLHGQSIQVPFKFSAPDGQSVIDRRLVPFAGQGKTSVAVLLDENNSNNPNASMFEIAIAAGGTTGLRSTNRAELWYFLGPAEVSSVALAKTKVVANDMMYAGAGAAREVAAPNGDVHAVIVAVPGGREGAARAGALPTPEVTGWMAAPLAPVVYPASKAKTYGPATIYIEPATAANAPLAASILTLPAGAKVAEHAHVKETELLYMLDGAGTMTIAGTDVPVVPTSVIQIPPNTKHAFTASAAVRALQIYTPAGPEQRFKKPPEPKASK
jgi:quercetin dioxygenase-like cupin family protein